MDKTQNKKSRIKKNRSVRRILSAHGVDLSVITIQCSLKTTILSGKLLKFGNQEFCIEEIALILMKIKAQTPNLTTDLENWNLNGFNIEKVPNKTRLEAYKHIRKSKFLDEALILDLD
jgi:hypothetical protein